MEAKDVVIGREYRHDTRGVVKIDGRHSEHIFMAGGRMVCPEFLCPLGPDEAAQRPAPEAETAPAPEAPDPLAAFVPGSRWRMVANSPPDGVHVGEVVTIVKVGGAGLDVTRVLVVRPYGYRVWVLPQALEPAVVPERRYVTLVTCGGYHAGLGVVAIREVRGGVWAFRASGGETLLFNDDDVAPAPPTAGAPESAAVPPFEIVSLFVAGALAQDDTTEATLRKGLGLPEAEAPPDVPGPESVTTTVAISGRILTATADVLRALRRAVRGDPFPRASLVPGSSEVVEGAVGDRRVGVSVWDRRVGVSVWDHGRSAADAFLGPRLERTAQDVADTAPAARAFCVRCLAMVDPAVPDDDCRHETTTRDVGEVLGALRHVEDNARREAAVVAARDAGMFAGVDVLPVLETFGFRGLRRVGSSLAIAGVVSLESVVLVDAARRRGIDHAPSTLPVSDRPCPRCSEIVTWRGARADGRHVCGACGATVAQR